MPTFTKADIERMIAGLPWKEWRSDFEDDLKKDAETISSAAGKVSAEDIGGTWEDRHPATSRHVANFVGEEITNIDTYTRQRLVDVLWESIEKADESIAATELAERMRTAVAESYTLSPSRALTIARTEAATLVNVGQLSAYQQNGIEQVEVSDGDDDEDCAEADGQVWTLEEALAEPIAHPNAVMAGTEVSPVGEVLRGYRARWNGPAISIRTSQGHRLAIGPNHPVLTTRGWFAAKALRVGDYVVTGGCVGRTGVSHADLDHVPAKIEQVFEALMSTGSYSAIVAAPTYFHGDGNSCEGNIDVIRADRALTCECDTGGAEKFAQAILVIASSQTKYLASRRPASLDVERIPLTPPSRMCGRHVGRVVGPATDSDSALTQPLADDAVGAPVFSRDARSRFSVDVAIDEIVEVAEIESFVGHAFDLETTYHAYFASGILVSNCVRSFSAVVPDETGSEE